MFLTVAFTPLAAVLGQSSNSLGVEILQVAPISSSSIVTGQSQYNGTAGQAFNLEGTIYNSNSSYQVLIGSDVVASGTSSGYLVDANFSVPYLSAGSYDMTLIDVALGVNSTGTTPESFEVLTGYYISAVPSQAQEGSNMAITVTVTGGAASTDYGADVTVVDPSNTTYSQTVSMGTINQEGVATAQVTYPGASFQPNGTTDYAGTYNIYFNQSTGLAQNQFTVGFLDSTTYHRGDTVTIGATGYQASQTATLTITNSTGGLAAPTQTRTASATGIINSTWLVPPNAVIGTYTVTITPQGIQKVVPDIENFTIPGYSVTIETVNLANELVSQIQINALDQASGVTYNETSGSNGAATFNLESGIYPLTAFWNGVNVGASSITVTGNATFTLQCQLTNIQIIVQNENGSPMPFVNLAILYQYQPSNGGASQLGNVTGQTYTNGSYTLASALTGITYTINASLYGQVFNSENNTFSNIPAQPVYQIVITCPNEALTLNVVGYNRAPISGASIDLVELTSGLFYTATTDSSGSAASQVSFGMYKLQIYEDNIMINETTIAVFGATQQEIVCSLYGIQVSVSVIDFFGQPISNANVTLNGPSTERLSAMTNGAGTATFNNVVGGNMQIVAFPQGAQSSYQAVTQTIDNPMTVKIQIDRYFVLGSLLIPVSSLIAIIIIVIAIVLFATVEIYRRRKVKQSPES